MRLRTSANMFKYSGQHILKYSIGETDHNKYMYVLVCSIKWSVAPQRPKEHAVKFKALSDVYKQLKWNV